MFWERDDLAEVSRVGELLQKSDVTLAEIVDEPLVLQDMRASNEKLIEFLKTPEHLRELLSFALANVPIGDDVDRMTQFSRAKSASDLLTVGGHLCESLLNNDECVDVLKSFIKASCALNPITMSFYVNILTTMFACQTTKCLEQFRDDNASDGFLEILLTHFDQAVVRDMLVKLSTSAENEDDTGALRQWLVDAGVGQALVGALTQTRNCTCMTLDANNCREMLHQYSAVHSKQFNAASTWIELVRCLRDVSQIDGPDAELKDTLLAHICTGDTVASLIEKSFAKGTQCEHMLVSACKVLILLLKAHHFPKCPSNLCALALSFERGSSTEESSTAVEDLPDNAPLALQTDANEFHMSRIGGHIDDSRSPIDEQTALRRREVEALLTDALPHIHETLMQKSLTTQARISVIRLLSSLMNNDYAPAHKQLNALRTLPTLMQVLFDEDCPNMDAVTRSQLIQTVLFSRPPVCDACPAETSDGTIAVASPEDAAAVADERAKQAHSTRRSGTSPLLKQLLVDGRLLTTLITSGKELSDASQCKGPSKRRKRAAVMQLVRVVELARLRGPNRRAIERILHESELHEQWLKFVNDVFKVYKRRTQSDTVSNTRDIFGFNANEDEETSDQLRSVLTAMMTQQIHRDENESRVRPVRTADELTKPELDTGFELKMPHVDVTKKVPDRPPVLSQMDAVDERLAQVTRVSGSLTAHPPDSMTPKKKNDFSSSSSSDSEEEEPENGAKPADSYFLQQRQRQSSAHGVTRMSNDDNWADFCAFPSKAETDDDWVSQAMNGEFAQQSPPDWSSKSATSEAVCGLGQAISHDWASEWYSSGPKEASPVQMTSKPPDEPPPPPPVPKRPDK